MISAYQSTCSSEDFIKANTIFSSLKKNILSSNFKGGVIKNCFAETVLDFNQADLHGKAILDISNAFGVIKLKVPSNWIVEVDLIEVGSGVKYKRREGQFNPDGNKVLILRGSSIAAEVKIVYPQYQV